MKRGELPIATKGTTPHKESFQLRHIAQQRMLTRTFPLSVGRIVKLVRGAGFVEAEYRTRLNELRSAISDDDLPSHHLLRHCVNEGWEYPIRLDLRGFRRVTRAPLVNRHFQACLVASLVNSHIATNPDCIFEGEFWRCVLPELNRIGHPYLLIGDSHSRLYRRVNRRVIRPIIPIHIVCTGGSAKGLNNPHSRSGYGGRLERLMQALSRVEGGKAVPIFFQFGQVDIEFVNIFRRIARSEKIFDAASFASFAEETAIAYLGFLTRVCAGFDRVHVLSVFPPALSNEAWAAGYVNAHVLHLESAVNPEEMAQAVRGLEIPSLNERTHLHRQFNHLLRARCQEQRFCYVELFENLLDADGVIARRYIEQSGGRDHHLDGSPLAKLTSQRIESAIQSRI